MRPVLEMNGNQLCCLSPPAGGCAELVAMRNTAPPRIKYHWKHSTDRHRVNTKHSTRHSQPTQSSTDTTRYNTQTQGKKKHSQEMQHCIQLHTKYYPNMEKRAYRLWEYMEKRQCASNRRQVSAHTQDRKGWNETQ